MYYNASREICIIITVEFSVFRLSPLAYTFYYRNNVTERIFRAAKRIQKCRELFSGSGSDESFKYFQPRHNFQTGSGFVISLVISLFYTAGFRNASKVKYAKPWSYWTKRTPPPPLKRASCSWNSWNSRIFSSFEVFLGLEFQLPDSRCFCIFAHSWIFTSNRCFFHVPNYFVRIISRFRHFSQL